MPGFKIVVNTPACSASFACPSEADDGSKGADPRTETARKHRYRFKVLEPVKEVLMYAYRSNRPVAEVDAAIMHYGQEEIQMPGKYRWAPLEVTFYEIVRIYNLTLLYLRDWQMKNMIKIKESKLGKIENYKYMCQLDMLDGCAKTIWSYQLFEVWPSKVTPSDLDYTSSDISETTATLQYAKALDGDVNMYGKEGEALKRS